MIKLALPILYVPFAKAITKVDVPFVSDLPCLQRPNHAPVINVCNVILGPVTRAKQYGSGAHLPNPLANPHTIH